ncbi:MAG TPA: nitroreductase family protein [Dehalococcoidia bacterium]|nr:nitroreductase family protein [Dehalococcoidia bacterium]
MNDAQRFFEDLIKGRRSIRRYEARGVEPATIDALLEAGTWAPSAHNRQPWRFAVLTGAEERETLARRMGERLRQARLADGDNVADVEGDVSRSHSRITGAPLVIVVFLTMEDMDTYPDPARQSAEQLMAVQGVAMAVNNILVAAHAAGLGACWMCAPLFCSDAVVEAVGAPVRWQAQALLTLGYPASKGKPAVRRALSDVVLSKR